MSVDSSNERLPEERQRIVELLSKETRHLVVQFVLGHPEHLMSLTELDHAIPKRRSEIRAQLERLVEAEILDSYCYGPNEDESGLPSEFYGPTERGIEILYEFKYLRGVPIVRALYQNSEKPIEVQQHENASRPNLPEGVTEALSIDDNCEETERTAEP